MHTIQQYLINAFWCDVAHLGCRKGGDGKIHLTPQNLNEYFIGHFRDEHLLVVGTRSLRMKIGQITTVNSNSVHLVEQVRTTNDPEIQCLEFTDELWNDHVCDGLVELLD